MTDIERIRALEDRALRIERQIGLTNRVRCAFCGEAVANNTHDDVRAHVLACPAHPMRSLERELAALKAGANPIRCKFCNEVIDHTTTTAARDHAIKCGDTHELVEVPADGIVDLTKHTARYLHFKIAAHPAPAPAALVENVRGSKIFGQALRCPWCCVGNPNHTPSACPEHPIKVSP